MFDSAIEDDWEWIELYNPGPDELDLTGWVLDDINATPVVAPNTAAGSIRSGGSAVLYNADDHHDRKPRRRRRAHPQR